MDSSESNSNSFGPASGGSSTASGPDLGQLRHGPFCCCHWCLQGAA